MQLHAIEEVEGAKGKLTGGLVKVDYATGEVWCAASTGRAHDPVSFRVVRPQVFGRRQFLSHPFLFLSCLLEHDISRPSG